MCDLTSSPCATPAYSLLGTGTRSYTLRASSSGVRGFVSDLVAFYPRLALANAGLLLRVVRALRLLAEQKSHCPTLRLEAGRSYGSPGERQGSRRLPVGKQCCQSPARPVASHPV